MVIESLKKFNLSPLTTGLVVASSVHLSGMFATLIIGAVSDYFERTSVLVFMGAAGAVCSVLMGYSVSWGAGWVLLMAFIGSFFILGDSGVLSAAIADHVPAEMLGSVIGLRSLLGFGIGSFSPLLFGEVIDVTHSWEMAYLVLAAGGVTAFISAITLRFRRFL